MSINLKSKESKSIELPKQIADQVVFITGVTRSGTTLLGKLIATLDKVEYEYESWTLGLFPMISQMCQVNQGEMLKLMRKYSNEFLIQNLLGRNVNMRKSDDSYVLNVISKEELEFRWNNLSSRQDVIDYAKKHKSIFSTKITNFHPFYEFLLNGFENVKIIHIVRNGLDVALSITKKGWYTDEWLNSSVGSAITNIHEDAVTGKKNSIPPHIPEEEAGRFIKSGLFERGLLSWCILMERNEIEKKRLSLNSSNFLELTYESFLTSPEKTIKQIAEFTQSSTTSFTDNLLKNVKSEKASQKQEFPISELSEEIIKRAEPIFKQYGYDLKTLRGN